VPPSDKRFQILCLSGGGYRGLHVARILEIIEEHIEPPVARHFDLIAGTSIGGIIALALALEIPAKRIRESLQAVGPTLFPQKPPDFARARAVFDKSGTISVVQGYSISKTDRTPKQSAGNFNSYWHN
jgi:patatin-like phospholipase/acyl hydrolase